jgi:dihydroxy-acid dehydratase
VGFGLKDIDEISRRVPCIAKVAPNGDYYTEDVNRAGGIPAILSVRTHAGVTGAHDNGR